MTATASAACVARLGTVANQNSKVISKRGRWLVAGGATVIFQWGQCVSDIGEFPVNFPVRQQNIFDAPLSLKPPFLCIQII